MNRFGVGSSGGKCASGAVRSHTVFRLVLREEDKEDGWRALSAAAAGQGGHDDRMDADWGGEDDCKSPCALSGTRICRLSQMYMNNRIYCMQHPPILALSVI